MPELTDEQRRIADCGGRCIVSASAGSGKTFVMIEKMCRYIEDGGDVEDVLAITFTVKAAAQMRDKLRSALIDRLSSCPGKARGHIKEQIDKATSADISTIHSFCARLLRTYYYKAGVPAEFEIATENDAGAMPLRRKAADELFSEMYSSGDEGFRLLSERFREKRGDDSLKKTMMRCYDTARNVPSFRAMLSRAGELYEGDGGFDRVCADMLAAQRERLGVLLSETKEYEKAFVPPSKPEVYARIFGEMEDGLRLAMEREDVFSPLPDIKVTPKPRDPARKKDGGEDEGDPFPGGEDEGDPFPGGEDFTSFRNRIDKAYRDACDGMGGRDEERERFLSAGETAKALCGLLLRFDERFTETKREAGVLDYGDLEHLALRLLEENEDVRRQVRERYARVYVDEFQDVNPVQDRIIDLVCGEESFFVGDRKQAIYGFRGCSSSFFTEKFERFGKGEGSALTLSTNFRSEDAVIRFVNGLFSEAMTPLSCGIDYGRDDLMRRDPGREEGAGRVSVDVIGRDEKEKEETDGVYSVEGAVAAAAAPSRQGLAAVAIIEEERARGYRYSDICILTRKRPSDPAGGSRRSAAFEMVRTIKNAGIPVSMVETENACASPEGKTLTDIVSYLDDYEQDIPLCSFMLSPVGGFTEGELAAVRTRYRERRGMPFRRCAEAYAADGRDPLAERLRGFFARRDAYRTLGETEGAGPLMDRVCLDAGWEASYSAGSGKKLRNIRAIRDFAYEDGRSLSVAGFLRALREANWYVAASDPVDSDSVKVMTMHASKGLEFPVVIVSDLCVRFTGESSPAVRFDREYGFALRCRDERTMKQSPTVLTRLVEMREQREDVKGELNLLYVACTRARESLHVMMTETAPHHPSDLFSATKHSDLADFYGTGEYVRLMDIRGDEASAAAAAGAAGRTERCAPDGELLERLDAAFERGYAYGSSEKLPVKCSVTRLTRREDEEEAPGLYLDEYETEYPAEAPDKWVIRDEAEPVARESADTVRDRGTAYHRFLEIAVRSGDVTTREAVDRKLSDYPAVGAMTAEQTALLDPDELYGILSMPVFDDICERDARMREYDVYCEQQFICSFPARELAPLGTDSDDTVLLQGVIDLLAVGKGARAGEARIIDYKYSSLPDAELVAEYADQVELYRKAVAKICGLDERKISTTIVNIRRRREIRVYEPGKDGGRRG